MEKRVVLITGCSSGFGRLAVEPFLQKGWRVVATVRDLNRRREAFAGLTERYPADLHLLELDITRESDRRAAIDYLEQNLGGELDCLINNAGAGLFGAFEAIDEKALREQLEVGFFGTAALTHTCLPLLRANRGRILFVTSILGLTALPFSSPYCAAKFAVEGLAEALYYELRPFGVQVGCIEPGGFATEFRSNRLPPGQALPEYETLTANYATHRDRTARRRKSDPARVAALMVSLAERRTVPLRSVIGSDARFTYLLRRLLPNGIFFPLSRATLLRWMLHPAKNDG